MWPAHRPVAGQVELDRPVEAVLAWSASLAMSTSTGPGLHVPADMERLGDRPRDVRRIDQVVVQ